MTEFPRIFKLHQDFDTPICEDLEGTVHAELARIGLDKKVQPGESIAITVGSRGITDIAEIIRATVRFFLNQNAQPFLVPAMGSHGGATAEGQREVIESYGVTEAFCGCPIRSSMETVTIGTADEGFPIFFDRHAFEADHVLVCGRIKSHTNFTGDIQSGLMKMMMIGLGKAAGASLYHRVIHEYGFPRVIRGVAPKVIEHANILAGLAILENAFDRTAVVEAVLPEDIQTREPALLVKAKQLMPSLPFPQIDVLIVDEMGKNISGTGMDTNIIGRKAGERQADTPSIQQVVVRGLTSETHGNAAGIGFAEFCLSRVVEAMDRKATVLNCLTALDVAGARIPVDFPTDQELVASALDMLGTTPPAQARLVWIKNTGKLTDLVASEALLPDVEGNPALTRASELRAMPFDQAGMLPDDQFATC